MTPTIKDIGPNHPINYWISEIKDIGLRNNINCYLHYHWRPLTTHPASIRHHHTDTGGLADHTVEVVHIGCTIIESLALTDRINRDHYIASALLHDLGKIHRYVYDDGALRWGYADSASLKTVNSGRMDHALFPIIDYPIVTGHPLPRPVALAIASHMGGFSKTSVTPNTLLEVVLMSADYISSHIEEEERK